MVAPQLALNALLAIAAAVVYGYVASFVGRRPASSRDARVALAAFATWWAGLAFVSAIGGAQALLGAAGILSLPVFTTLLYLVILAIAAALWGLVYYLVFIYTGNPRLLVPVTGFYMVLAVFLLYLVAWLSPDRVLVTDWAVTVGYAKELDRPLGLLSSAVLLLPVILAAVAYATLYFRTENRAMRYRVALVSGSFIFWFGTSLLASAIRMNAEEWWPLASRVIGLVSTFFVLLAYRPPRAITRRLGSEPPAAEEAADAPNPFRLAPPAPT